MNSLRGAIAGSGVSPCLIRLGLAKVTTRGRPPLRQVRPLWASCAASAAVASHAVLSCQIKASHQSIYAGSGQSARS